MSDIPSLINVTVSITEHDDCSVSYAVSAEGGDLCHKSHATIESAARDIGASIYEAAVGIKRLPPAQHTVSPLRKKLNRALWLIIGLENGVALSHCAIDDPAQRRELLAAKDAITEALDLEGAARSTEVSDLKIVDDGAVSDIARTVSSTC